VTEELLTKKSLVEKYLAESRQCLSAFSFVNIFSWQNFFTFEFKEIDGNLCIFARNESGMFLYLPPLGKEISPQAVEDAFAYMAEYNQGSGVTRVENAGLNQLAFFDKAHYDYIPKAYEYCYAKNEVASLQGNRYKSQRSAYNQCVKRYFSQYVPFELGMLEDCGKLYQKWAEERKCKNDEDIYTHMLEENARVHRLVTRYYQELNLVGRVVIINDEIKAYTFGFALNEEMFCVLFEITDLAVRGLSAYIFREFCSDDVLSKYSWINVMDDFGLDNVKKTKASYYPSALVPSYGIGIR